MITRENNLIREISRLQNNESRVSADRYFCISSQHNLPFHRKDPLYPFVSKVDLNNDELLHWNSVLLEIISPIIDIREYPVFLDYVDVQIINWGIYCSAEDEKIIEEKVKTAKWVINFSAEQVRGFQYKKRSDNKTMTSHLLSDRLIQA